MFFSLGDNLANCHRFGAEDIEPNLQQGASVARHQWSSTPAREADIGRGLGPKIASTEAVLKMLSCGGGLVERGCECLFLRLCFVFFSGLVRAPSPSGRNRWTLSTWPSTGSISVAFLEEGRIAHTQACSLTTQSVAVRQPDRYSQQAGRSPHLFVSAKRSRERPSISTISTSIRSPAPRNMT